MYFFKFPTTSLLVDDNLTFSQSMGDMLLEHNFYSICIENQGVISFLKRYADFLDNFNSFFEDHFFGDSTIILNKVPEIMKNSNRFRLISSLVIDYNMPVMNGQEICEAISEKFLLRKIILTGEIFSHNAVKLLDKGVIDVFVEKGEHGFLEKILEEVAFNGEHYQYFANCSHDVVQDVKLQEFILNFIDSIKPCEYYIFNKNGSYIFLDENAKPSGLMILTDQELRTLYEFLKIEFPSDAEVEEIKMGNKMPVLFSQDFNLYRLKQNIMSCGVIQGEKEKYYFVYTDIIQCFDFDFTAVKSYKVFLKEGSTRLRYMY